MGISFVHHLTVRGEAIDINGHVNNVFFVQWMQDAAVAHAQAVGGDVATSACGGLWVARSHHVEYKRQAFLGDELEVKTWIADCRMVSSRRKYEFWRVKDKVLLAKGETDWVLIDAATHRPMEIPETVQVLYRPTEGEGAEG